MRADPISIEAPDAPRRMMLCRPSLSYVVLGALAATMLAGCQQRAAAPRRAAAAAAASQRDARGLFDSIRTQLRTLPEAAQLELAPPTVVLDSRSSTDGEEIEGLLGRRPGASSEPANYVSVPRGNARFRDNVRPGDQLKYFGVPDRDTRDRLRETGEVDIATFESIDLVVAQVLSDNELLIVGGFAQEDIAPRKIEVWRTVDKRMDEMLRQLGEYIDRREPPLEWHPTPDESSIAQLTERLNQWLRQVGLTGKKATAKDWKRPALLATLPDGLTKNAAMAGFVSDADLTLGPFRPYESRLLQGATWSRDVARWARGGAVEPAAVAAALFDWVARNVQLVEAEECPPRWPWETLLHGRGTAAGRAWLFAELCQQQNLTAVAVEVPTADGDYLLVGVVDGDQLRLFDPALGLALPGPVEGSVATLAEAIADGAVLRRLDLDGQPFPLTAESLKKANLGVVATPFALTRRAAEFASRLTAEERMSLAVDIDETAERVAKIASKPVLWPYPFQTLADKQEAKPSQRRLAVREFLPFAWRPPLWRGRLQHFRGVKEDPEAKRDVLDEALDDHRAAQGYYMDRRVRPAEARLATVPEDKREIYRSARTYATLFLAALRYDEGSYEVAQQWLENAAMDDASAEPLRPMIEYLKARTLEARGDWAGAAKVLDKVEGPMAAGAKLRARQLRERPATPPVEAAEDEEAAGDTP